MTPLQTSPLSLNADGTPWSSLYEDVYFSLAGAQAQAEHVFLQGNDLPARWQQRDCFVIVETGFGLGNNFLATWAAWQQDPQRAERLHFISVEKHPLSQADLQQGLHAAKAPEALVQQLLHHWPLALPGVHRLEFEAGRVVLSLFFGDAAAQLSQISARADAIYLDGFSPAKNPEIWSPAVFSALGGLSDANTTLATWSVASTVCEGLTHAGFVLEKIPGFANKREMLRGRFRGQRPRLPHSTPERILVIGAGLAGSSIAERLAQRGCHVDLLEAQEDIAQSASGNLAGAFRPLPSKDDNILSRITRAGFSYGLRHLAQLKALGQEVLWEACGALHLARNPDGELKQQAVIASLNMPREYINWVDAKKASHLAGHTANFGGWWFPSGGWIQPRSLCQANIAAGAANIHLHTNKSVWQLQRDGAEWCALDANGILIARAPQVVLANAVDARRLAQADWLPLRAARGQVSHLPMAQLAPLGVVVCGQGYITPGIGGHAALGASFVLDDFDLALREDEHAENLAKLGLMLPDMAEAITATALDGRVGMRPVTADRLPLVGRMPIFTSGEKHTLTTLPRQEGLWLITGFGARGLVWSSLCAELLASQICQEPLPLERELADAMDPGRFILSPAHSLHFPTD